jgi:hypothetical protein
VSSDQTANTTARTGELARDCPVCRTTFTAASHTSRQVYCSPTCREANRQHIPVQRTCPVCRSEFTTDVSPRRVFCSTACRTTARTSKDHLEERTCPTCDNTFEAARTVRQVYCSPPAARTPTAAAARPATRNEPAAWARVRPRRCRRFPNCPHHPNRPTDPEDPAK